MWLSSNVYETADGGDDINTWIGELQTAKKVLWGVKSFEVIIK